MIKKLFFASCLAFSFVALAQQQDETMAKYGLDKVNALRATSLTPMSFTNISKDELEQQVTSDKIYPILLSLTPSSCYHIRCWCWRWIHRL